MKTPARFLLLFLPLLCAHAQASGPRYLVFVETSSATSRQKETVADTVCSLILSGFDGQVKAGQRVAIWPFNERVFPEQFPVEPWNPDTKPLLNARVANFLRRTKFERGRDMSRVNALINRALETSNPLTVFIVTSGENGIVGTPFDRDVNEILAEHGKRLRAQRKPFVVVLVGQEGQLTQWAVHAGGDSPIPVPALPEPGRLARGDIGPPPLLNRSAQSPTPEILRTNSPLTSAESPPIPSLPAAEIPKPVPQTERVEVQPQSPPPEPVIEPPPAAPAIVAETPPEEPEVVETPAPAPRTNDLAVPGPSRSTPPPLEPPAASPQDAAQIVPLNAPIPAAARSDAVPPQSVPAFSDPERTAQDSVVAVPPVPVPMPMPPPAAPQATSSQGTPAPSVPIPVHRGNGRAWLFVTAGVLLVVAGALSWRWMRRPRGESSFISRSLERHRP